MPVTTMSQMWSLLQVHTVKPNGEERPVNHLNEWGGFSKRLGMPVFTAWRDLTDYDKDEKTTKALVLDTTWSNPVGVNNQQYWLSFAESQNDGIAAFFIIHAANVNAEPRKVQYIDADKAFIGKVIRDGSKTYIVGQPKRL